jgi:histidinol-phosphatase
MAYERETDIALTIARKAGELAMHHFNRETPVEEKYDFSPVTIADRECEKLIAGMLHDAFPEDGIIGEEGTRIHSKSGRRWIIDPIDGTRDFVRRNGIWAVQLALQIGSRSVVGVINCPCIKEMLHAVDGSGCYWNDTRVTASAISSLDKSIFMVSGFKIAWSSWPAEAVRLLTEKCWMVRCYGGCYDIMMLARGKADIWLSGIGMEWDYAPIQVVARECGARFTTRTGDDRIDAKHCVVFTPGVEKEICSILGIVRS